MNQHQIKCPVCQVVHATTPSEGGIGVGWMLCPTHAPMEDTYVALVEVDGPCDCPDTAKPTGRFVHLLRSGWSSVLSVPCPEASLIYVERGFIDRLDPIINQKGAV